MVSEALSNADIISEVAAAEGDLTLVAERLNCTVVDVRKRFIDIVSDKSNTNTANILESLVMLNYLQFAGELRLTLMAMLPELSASEVFKAFTSVSDAVIALANKVPATPVQVAGGDTYNFNGSDIIDRVANRLADLRRNDNLIADPNVVDGLVTGRN